MGADEPRRAETPNPYAPPATAPAAPAPALARGASTYAVDVERKLPPVCLKCGATERITRREERFTVSPAARGIGASGGVIGAVVANATRHDTSLMLPLLVVIGVVLTIVVWVVNKAAKHVHLSLPLCASCDERWRAGVTIRRWLLSALAIAGVCLLLGLAAQSTPVAAAGGALLFVMIVVAFAVKLPLRFVTVQRVDGSLATLGGVSPAAIAALEQGGLPKKAKRNKNALQ